MVGLTRATMWVGLERINLRDSGERPARSTSSSQDSDMFIPMVGNCLQLQCKLHTLQSGFTLHTPMFHPKRGSLDWQVGRSDASFGCIDTSQFCRKHRCSCFEEAVAEGCLNLKLTFRDRMAKKCEVRGLCSQVRPKCDLSSHCSGGRALSRCAWMGAFLCFWHLAMSHVVVSCQFFDGLIFKEAEWELR